MQSILQSRLFLDLMLSCLSMLLLVRKGVETPGNITSFGVLVTGAVDGAVLTATVPTGVVVAVAVLTGADSGCCGVITGADTGCCGVVTGADTGCCGVLTGADTGCCGVLTGADSGCCGVLTGFGLGYDIFVGGADDMLVGGGAGLVAGGGIPGSVATGTTGIIGFCGVLDLGCLACLGRGGNPGICVGLTTGGMPDLVCVLGGLVSPIFISGSLGGGGCLGFPGCNCGATCVCTSGFGGSCGVVENCCCG